MTAVLWFRSAQKWTNASQSVLSQQSQRIKLTRETPRNDCLPCLKTQLVLSRGNIQEERIVHVSSAHVGALNCTAIRIMNRYRCLQQQKEQKVSLKIDFNILHSIGYRKKAKRKRTEDRCNKLLSYGSYRISEVYSCCNIRVPSEPLSLATSDVSFHIFDSLCARCSTASCQEPRSNALATFFRFLGLQVNSTRFLEKAQRWRSCCRFRWSTGTLWPVSFLFGFLSPEWVWRSG